MKRTGALAMLGLGVVSLAVGLARAEEKKPGMFDFERWKSPVAREREAAGNIAPTGLDLTPAVPSTGEPRLIRLRVYADSDYRGLVMRWQARLRAQIARVNAVMGPVFNARFEIESIRSWDRSHVGMAFDPILKELEALDPAREVDLVLGLVTPARGVATSLHQLGEAFTPGHHIVLRGMDDEQEGQAIDRDYHLLPEDERERLYVDRKGHKEVVLFLHEWGHSAGLLHEEDRSMIMNPAYDHRQTGFGPFDKQVLALVIQKRQAFPGEAFPERAELLKLYERAPLEVGSDSERARILAFLRSSPGGHTQGGAASPPSSGLSNADVDSFNSALSAAKAEHPDEAWRILAPLLVRLRENKATADAWTRAARLASAIGALTAAEEAIGHVPRGGVEIEKIAVDVEMTRQRVALPPGPKGGVPKGDVTNGGVAPELEPAYVAGFWATAKSIGSGELPTARARLEAFAAAFPDTPGVDLLSCDLELRAKHAAAAKKRCEAAVTKYRYAQRAHYLLGLLAVRAGRGAVAEQQLQEAIHIDPQDAGSWRTLAQLYRAQRARGRLDELARKYQAAFAAPLPE
jgi:tetratricopeptide (TPR) repeat protein